MKMYRSPSISQGDGRQDDKGFTLIEILIAIVLVGILSAVAVVGISNLVSKGGTSACQASADAGKAGSAVYFASNSTYPPDFLALTTVTGTSGIPMTLPANTTNLAGTAIVAGNLAVKSGSWTLTMTAGTATAAPVFTCS
jgi:prepilin-type N-terminal cleavage/methylation domain-containing protein